MLSFTGSPYEVNPTEIITERICRDKSSNVKIPAFAVAASRRQANAKGMPKRINVKTFLVQIS